MVMFKWEPGKLAICAACAGLAALVFSGGFLANTLDEKAWMSGLEQSRDDRGLFAKAPEKPLQRVSVLDGLSGLQVKPGSKLSILKFNKPSVKAVPVLHSGFMDQIAVGDRISITNSAGKTVHFRVQKMQAPKAGKLCGDLHEPQKDTKLMDCLSNSQQAGAEAGQYRLEVIETPAGANDETISSQQSS